jgi:isopentenyl diphosphate isomerase/L-lactate dehydrogenase-like FMN-dependent dehydrogenase
MRKVTTLALSFLFSIITVSAFSQTTDTASANAAGATAKVIFMRSTGGQGALIPFSTFIDDKLVCRLNNKHFSTHAVPAGTHTVSVQVGGKEAAEKAAPITINAEAGKTYYIQMVSKVGLLINNLSCKEVTEDAANKVLSKLKEDADCL